MSLAILAAVIGGPLQLRRTELRSVDDDLAAGGVGRTTLGMIDTPPRPSA